MYKILPLLLIALLISCQQEKTIQKEGPKKYSAKTFFENISVRGGRFSNDSERILFSSDKSGIFNLYEYDIKSGKTSQLTNSTKESYYAIDYDKNADGILYRADKGGNELSHIFYRSGKEGAEYEITKGENEKAVFLKWSEDKKSIFYISNLRDPKAYDIYKLSGNMIENDAELFFQNDDALSIGSVSYDEKYVSLTEAVNNDEQKLYLKEINSNKKVLIDLGIGMYNSLFFSKDNNYMYFLSNGGTNFTKLYRYNISEQKSEVVYEDEWDVSSAYQSESGEYLILTVNEDARNKVIMFNSKMEKLDLPNITDGKINSIQLSPDETKMLINAGSSNTPNDIYLAEMGGSVAKKITNNLSENISQDDLAKAEVIRYKSFDGLEIPSVYYKPLNASPENKVPAIVFVHGGPGGQSRVGYRALTQFLVNHGYAVLLVNNRGSSGYGKEFYHLDDKNHGDKDLKDCIWGKNWLQTQADIDSENIGIAGGSYGGYMVMAAMTFAPEEFKVGVDIFGVTNWLRTLKSIPPYWESFRNSLYTELGDPYGPDSTRLYEISPLFHADQIKNPIMVLQGANDPRVLKVESDEIVEAARKNGIPVEYVVFEDEGHGFNKKENQIEYATKMLAFLDKYLKN